MLEQLLQIKKSRVEHAKFLERLEMHFTTQQNAFIEATKRVQEEVMKGNSFDALLNQPIKEKFNKVEEIYKSEKERVSSILAQLDDEIEEIYKSDVELEVFRDFDVIQSSETFVQNVQNLSKAHGEGKVSDEEFVQLKGQLLKFMDLNYKDQLYKGYSNKTHYADAIIINENREILLVRRNKDEDFEPGKYALPGGHIEPAENPEYACKREVFEELNINLSDAKLLPVGIYTDENVQIHYFATRINSAEELPVLEERELIQLEWVKLEDLKDKDLLKNLKENFENVISFPISLI